MPKLNFSTLASPEDVKTGLDVIDDSEIEQIVQSFMEYFGTSGDPNVHSSKPPVKFSLHSKQFYMGLLWAHCSAQYEDYYFVPRFGEIWEAAEKELQS